MRIKKMTGFLSFVTFNNIIGITLAPFGIYLKERYLTNAGVINHESIHWKQQIEMLIIFFYIWYIVEWFLRLFINFGKAYRSISFEREAYDNECKKEYLQNRKPYSWIKYLFK